MTQQHPKQANQDMIRLKFFGIGAWIESFLRDCRSRKLSPFTLKYYHAGPAYFSHGYAINRAQRILWALVKFYRHPA